MMFEDQTSTGIYENISYIEILRTYYSFILFSSVNTRLQYLRFLYKNKMFAMNYDGKWKWIKWA